MRCKHERQEEEEGPHLGRGCPPGTSRPAPRPAPPRPSTGAAARSPAPRLRLFVIPREWARRGPGVRARAEGRRISSGTPRPAHPGPPGTLLHGTWRWESRGASREPVNLSTFGAGHLLPSLPLPRPLCGNYHSLPGPPPPGISSITPGTVRVSVCVSRVCEFSSSTRACPVCVRLGLGRRVHVG
jgi:hypothetical protein